ncbi:MAG TPA: hypothetical protein VLS90_01805 [Thermodesulfobacteriota bacterium]|nr:hypothetical protein [Thermodesulfobacteriota bacterium]
MKSARFFKLGCLFLIFIGLAAWTMDASGQEKKDFENYMPLCKGTHWQKANSDAKVAFIWGAAHVILIENLLMEKFPELKRENFSAKVVEARRARVTAGKAMTMNEIVRAVDQFYKDHPEQLETPVLQVIWDSIKGDLKTGVAGRPLK